MLSLNGKKITLHNLKVTARQQLSGSDASGASSATSQAESGDKAKVIAVTGTIKYSNAKHLSTLFSLAGAKENGARTIYRVVNRTAEAVKVSQVKFQGNITAQEDVNLSQWLVSFELVEHKSVAEKKESREPPKAAKQQKVDGETSSKAVTESPPETEPELTGFMAVLKKIDDALA